jgi:hypothetical protein
MFPDVGDTEGLEFGDGWCDFFYGFSEEGG